MEASDTKDFLGNETFFTVWVRDGKAIRAFQPEHDQIETIEEALALVQEQEAQFGTYRVVGVFRHDYDVPRRDVTEDLAVMWADAIKCGGDDFYPDFVLQHVPSSYDVGYSGNADHDDGDDEDGRVVAMHRYAAEGGCDGRGYEACFHRRR